MIDRIIANEKTDTVKTDFKRFGKSQYHPSTNYKQNCTYRQFFQFSQMKNQLLFSLM